MHCVFLSVTDNVVYFGISCPKFTNVMGYFESMVFWELYITGAVFSPASIYFTGCPTLF